MRICFIGDSFVNGTGDPEGLGWSGRICAAARHRGQDLTAYNLGVRRETTRDIAARWRHEAEPRLPAEEDGRLVFSFGVNDANQQDGRRRVPQEETVEIVGTMLAQARDWKPTLVVGPPPIADESVNARVRDLIRDFEALCRVLGIPFLDVYPALSGSEVWMRETAAGDGAHPGAEGYAVFAEQVGSWPAWGNWTR